MTAQGDATLIDGTVGMAFVSSDLTHVPDVVYLVGDATLLSLGTGGDAPVSPVLVWNGTAWVARPILEFDGTTWVPA